MTFVITMDLNGISWIGDMYNKLETMCVEVEETMYQDTVKYVENQMQTVGVSVKKFYSDVMQDLLPPSSLDPVKEENPSMPAAHSVDVSFSEKTKVKNEVASVNSKARQLVKDSAIVAKGDNNVNYETGSAVCFVNKPYEPTLHNSFKEQCSDENLDSNCAEKNSSNLQTYMPKDLDNRQDWNLKSTHDISNLNVDMKESSGDELTCSEVFSEIDELLSMSKLTSVLEVKQVEEDEAEISEEMWKGNRTVNDVEKSKATITYKGNKSMPKFGETSILSNASETVNFDAANQGVIVGKEFDRMKLGESCVLVDTSEHSFKLPLASEQKSYKVLIVSIRLDIKGTGCWFDLNPNQLNPDEAFSFCTFTDFFGFVQKKIRDVFSPRRWSKGKQDEEQLAVWYGEQTGSTLLRTSLKHAGISDSQQHEYLELEWELV